ncbi:hypothetical protein ES702_07300 [subsurface metagenome]
MNQILLRVTDSQKKKLERTRLLTGASISATVRKAIDEFYDREQTKLGDQDAHHS